VHCQWDQLHRVRDDAPELADIDSPALRNDRAGLSLQRAFSARTLQGSNTNEVAPSTDSFARDAAVRDALPHREAVSSSVPEGPRRCGGGKRQPLPPSSPLSCCPLPPSLRRVIMSCLTHTAEPFDVRELVWHTRRDSAGDGVRRAMLGPQGEGTQLPLPLLDD
jgi:hypothetical protein